MKFNQYLIIESVINENLADIKTKEIDESVITDLVNKIKAKITHKPSTDKKEVPAKPEEIKVAKMEVQPHEVETIKQAVKSGNDKKIFDELVRMVGLRISLIQLAMGGF